MEFSQINYSILFDLKWSIKFTLRHKLSQKSRQTDNSKLPLFSTISRGRESSSSIETIEFSVCTLLLCYSSLFTKFLNKEGFGSSFSVFSVFCILLSWLNIKLSEGVLRFSVFLPEKLSFCPYSVLKKVKSLAPSGLFKLLRCSFSLSERDELRRMCLDKFCPEGI